jgi:UDP-N-acetylmuramoyl-tripeptide--D-alanyl-D-alanine ligase
MPIHHLHDFLRITGARLQSPGLGHSATGFHFDSRLIEKGYGFMAMQGENQDGHSFVEAAIERGASWILASTVMVVPEEVSLLLHPDPLSCLQAYAAWYRRELSGVLLGVTGSCGKTTAKDCLRILLGGQSFASHRNYNNFLGLPLSLTQMDRKASFGIFECGISTPGEMDLLSSCLVPQVAVITNITSSHLENFNSYEDLVREKLAIARYMRQDSALFLPQSLFTEIAPIYETLGYQAILTPLEEDSWGADSKLLAETFGVGPAQTLAYCAEVVVAMGLARDQVHRRLHQVTLSPLRMERRKINGTEVVLDCYNASPDSIQAFFRSFAEPEKVTLVLGDMLELGAASKKEHEKIYHDLLQRRFSKVFLLGDEFARSASNCPDPRVSVMNSKMEILQALRIEKPEVLGLKGSRKFSLETLVEAIESV